MMKINRLRVFLDSSPRLSQTSEEGLFSDENLCPSTDRKRSTSRKIQENWRIFGVDGATLANIPRIEREWMHNFPI